MIIAIYDWLGSEPPTLIWCKLCEVVRYSIRVRNLFRLQHFPHSTESSYFKFPMQAQTKEEKKKLKGSARCGWEKFVVEFASRSSPVQIQEWRELESIFFIRDAFQILATWNDCINKSPRWDNALAGLGRTNACSGPFVGQLRVCDSSLSSSKVSNFDGSYQLESNYFK